MDSGVNTWPTPESTCGDNLSHTLCAFRAISLTRILTAPMFSDPAATAWIAAGRPNVAAPASVSGRCGRCGSDEATVASSHVISEKFTGFDAWPYGSRRLCTCCAWAYSRPPTAQCATLITHTDVIEYSDGSDLAATLIAGPLTDTQAAMVPTTRRRHILPASQWGHLAADDLPLRWDADAAARLADLAWLRGTIGASWPQLSKAAPHARLVTTQPSSHWPRIMNTWAQLQPWRSIPPMWAAARILTNGYSVQRTRT